jgi:hypothetical protein
MKTGDFYRFFFHSDLMFWRRHITSLRFSFNLTQLHINNNLNNIQSAHYLLLVLHFNTVRLLDNLKKTITYIA